MPKTARFSDSEDEGPKKKPKSRAVESDEEDSPPTSQRDPRFNDVHGSQFDAAKLDEELAGFSAADWAELSSQLLTKNVDSDTESELLHQYFNLFYKLFCCHLTSETSVCERMKAICPSTRTMKDQFHLIQERFGSLHVEYENRDLLDLDTDVGRETKRKLGLISYCIKTSYDFLTNARLLQHAHDPITRAALSEMSPETFFQTPDLNKLKKPQRIYYYYLHLAFNEHYMRDGDALYEPRYNDEGVFVHAYKYVCDISEFVFNGIFPIERNFYWFDCLTAAPNTAPTLIKQLSTVKTEWLPDLKRNDMIHAFRNGILYLEDGCFYPFKPKEGQPGVEALMTNISNIIAIKFHDLEFDWDGIQEDIAKYGGYMGALFPEMKMLLDKQKFSEEEQKVILAFGGRLLYPLGKLEAWQVFPYFLGLAGTGKSLFLRLVAQCLEKRDVAILSNALQKQFALDGIHDKKMFLALDIDEHFQLDQTTFQSMVSGEEVSVIRKHKQPLTVVWAMHGGAAGNKLPHWTDNGGSLTRRLVVIEFLVRVCTSDPQLFQKCCAKMDRFLYVIVSAYRDMASKFKHANIKEMLPKKFLLSEKRALNELNTLGQFLEENCEIEPFDEKKDHTFDCSFNDFNAAFKKFCQLQSIQNKTLTYTFYNGVFAKYQIKVVDNLKGENKAYKGRYITGVKLRPQTAMDIKG